MDMKHMMVLVAGEDGESSLYYDAATEHVPLVTVMPVSPSGSALML